MAFTGIVISPDGSVKKQTFHGYYDLYNAVGGYLELLPLRQLRHVAYINEDGIALGLPRNRLATDLCFQTNVGLHPNDYIKGVMVIAGPGDDAGEDTDVSPEMLARFGL